MPTLVEIDSKRTHTINGHATIGRADSCSIRVDDSMVSAVHAEIVQTPDGYQLRDLDSRRGTYVGARKISQASLRDGDEVLIGPMRLRFEADAAAPEQEELIRLRAIVELGRAIGVEHDLEQLCARVLETCFQLVGADRGAIVLYDQSSKAPYLTVTRTRSGEHAEFAVSASVLGQVMASHESYMNSEADDDHVLERSQSLSVYGVRSVMAVPLRYVAGETEWLGVIQLDSRARTRLFAARDRDLLEAIAGPAALAIKNAMLVRKVQTVTGEEWRRFERVVRDLPIGIVVLDGKRRCTLVNRWIVARDAFAGVRPGSVIDDIVGVPCDELVGGERRTHVIRSKQDRILTVTANTTADGREAVIVIADTTEEYERQNQAAHRDRVALIGQLAGGVAHDFNNLLQAILTSAGMLEDSVEHMPDALEDARQITHAATTAADLTRQLLTFSRRELVMPRVVDVGRVVHGMEKLLLRTLGSRIELVTTIGPRIPRLLIDPAQLEQILMNLVVNARDAIAGAGRISLAVDTFEVDGDHTGPRGLAPGRYVYIEVADNGPGMAPEILARVFEPYFTTKARGKGTGLGLATVHGIVQQAHGEIAIDSALDKGTTFRIYLPATEHDAEPERAPSRAAPFKGTILIVDDDELVRRTTERLLKSSGLSILSADSAQRALEVSRAHRGKIDVLLTDIVMPGMSGRDLARELASLRPDTRVLFMSGYHQHTPIEGSQFISKPFDRANLFDKLREVLDQVASGSGSRGSLIRS